MREFEAAVALFRSKGVRVKVFEDVDDGVERPDSIFPNNWFSCHDDGTVFVYPMLSECRSSVHHGPLEIPGNVVLGAIHL